MAAALSGRVPAAVGCELEETTTAGDPDRVVTKVERQTGAQATIQDGVVRIEASDEDQAWAIATWAVTHAQAEEITAVTVAGHRWDRANNPLNWEIISSDVEDTTVAVTLG